MDPNDATEIAYNNGYNNGYNKAVNDMRGEGFWTAYDRGVTRQGFYRPMLIYIHKQCKDKDKNKSLMHYPARFCPACGVRMISVIHNSQEANDDKTKTSRRT